ncbi:MAG TPA: DUF5606 domain-containing protein [Cyclobacteriaceae bacterium]|nr:DUF5606 domain-containing protein [Cyclobacteriaceae bacterium]HRW98009.1 DUF5606 domain-containing protein [Cyclobacteriaceae bacterium]
MKLNEIASVTGKGGLFKVLKPAKAGLILEALDESKSKLMATASHKVSILDEISIYTHSKEGTTPLEEVLKKINTEYGNDLGLDANADGNELRSFLKSVLPDYDEEKVYVSDIKKLVKWYSILQQYAPEVFQQEKEKDKPKDKEEKKD